MKRYLLAGLSILIPILISLITIIFAIDLITAPFYSLIEKGVMVFENHFNLEPKQHLLLTEILSRFIALLVLLISAIILGFFAHRFIMEWFLAKLEAIFQKIPVIRSIFHISKDLSGQFLQSQKSPFKSTVLIPFPGDKTTCLGFVTAEITGKFKEAVKDAEVCVFIPTSPHPVCGFVLLTPRHFLTKVDITTDEAFRFILSCGAADLDTDPIKSYAAQNRKSNNDQASPR